MPPEVQIIPHPELWFEDGNIELIAENVSFRVHKTVLAGSSDFFKDMFSLPQPPPEEPAEGEAQPMQTEIPRLETSETAEDLAYFLDAMYNCLRLVSSCFSKSHVQLAHVRAGDERTCKVLRTVVAD